MVLNPINYFSTLPLLILVTTISDPVQSLSSYDRSDSYGVYYYTSYGDKRYTRCYGRYARTYEDCRSSSYGRYNNYNDRYDYDRYSGRSDYYEDRVNLGRGSYRLLNNGRDVEMTCEFPSGSHLISNIVWERADQGRDYYTYNSYRSNTLGYLGGRMSVRSYGADGSILTIRDFDTSRDAGRYRCLATRTYRGYSSYSSGNRETVYMEVDFNPRYGDGGYGRDYNSYFNRYDNYNRYNRPYYGYSYSKTSEDNAVIDNNLKSENKEDTSK